MRDFGVRPAHHLRFSALQRAEIAEMVPVPKTV